MKCQFKSKDGKCTCIKCGFSDIYFDCTKMHRNCPGIKLQKHVKQENECRNCKEPTLIQKAKNYGVALAQHVKAGMPIVSEEVQQQRIKICEGCPLFNQDNRTCTLCGCPMDEKTRWAEQACAKKMIGEKPLWESET